MEYDQTHFRSVIHITGTSADISFVSHFHITPQAVFYFIYPVSILYLTEHLLCIQLYLWLFFRQILLESSLNQYHLYL